MLILKSCADLLKFDLELVKAVDKESISKIDEDAACQWPK